MVRVWGLKKMAAKIRPVYCGNFEYDARQSEIERLFKEYGRVDRVDMKTGKCLGLFIHVLRQPFLEAAFLF